MDVEQLADLRSPGGRELVATAADCLRTEAGDLQQAAELRRRHPSAPPDLTAAALTVAALRRAAVSKLGDDADCVWATRDALEQATRRSVAEHRAARLAAAKAGARLVDLGCGLGADLVAAARAGLRVTGVDSDPLRVALAEANLTELGLDGSVLCSTAEIIDVAGQTHALQRDQIRALTASDKSVMPEGFEALPPEDLTHLLEYLGTSKVKH